MAEPPVPERERGAALLTVLLLVAVMSVVAASGLERLTLATRLTGNASQIDQLRAFQLAAETIAAGRIQALVSADPDRTQMADSWNGVVQPIPLPIGTGTVRVTDGGNCFNLNTVVSGDDGVAQVSPNGITEFRGLMDAVGIDANAASAIANATADWIDADSSPQPNGAEDEVYARAPTPYRPANHLMADPSELRAVQGVTPAVYAALKPWVCALPTSKSTPINVNTLLPDQAPLLMMMAPGQISSAQAQSAIAARPAGGFTNGSDIFANLKISPTNGSVGVKTRWFAVETNVALGNATSRETALFDAGKPPVRLVQRQWGDGT